MLSRPSILLWMPIVSLMGPGRFCLMEQREPGLGEGLSCTQRHLDNGKDYAHRWI
jgi:hypothetical protein